MCMAWNMLGLCLPPRLSFTQRSRSWQGMEINRLPREASARFELHSHSESICFPPEHCCSESHSTIVGCARGSHRTCTPSPIDPSSPPFTPPPVAAPAPPPMPICDGPILYAEGRITWSSNIHCTKNRLSIDSFPMLLISGGRAVVVPAFELVSYNVDGISQTLDQMRSWKKVTRISMHACHSARRRVPPPVTPRAIEAKSPP
mmetsp:Transcript_13516/g.31531  ORF Transcript_13516/g.31531 Transcript_13516/m.31531 type:complete len:203 (-) Transcript_13516:317-925(-)